MIHKMSHAVLATNDDQNGYCYNITKNQKYPLKHADAYDFFAQAVALNCTEAEFSREATIYRNGDHDENADLQSKNTSAQAQSSAVSYSQSQECS